MITHQETEGEKRRREFFPLGEIIQKALVAGIPIVACLSAASSLAAQLAWEFNLTLVGFLRDKRFVIYTGDDRVRLGT